ncbi:MAG: hypothetical protein ACYC0Q_05980 [Eubacteriales bacterium]
MNRGANAPLEVKDVLNKLPKRARKVCEKILHGQEVNLAGFSFDEAEDILAAAEGKMLKLEARLDDIDNNIKEKRRTLEAALAEVRASMKKLAEIKSRGA